MNMELEDLKDLGLDDSSVASLDAAFRLMKHVQTQLDNNTAVITGDTSHESVRYLLSRAGKSHSYLKDRLDIASAFLFMKFDAVTVDEVIAGTNTISLKHKYGSLRCSDCGDRLHVELCGNMIKIVSDEVCANYSTFSVEIDFPTGEIVYDDWPVFFSELKDAGYVREEDGGDLNTAKGTFLRSKGYEEQGILHMFVGNTCPGLYYDKSTDGITIGKPLVKGSKKIGSFCTDLWWATMLDKSRYDEMIKLAGLEGTDDGKGVNVVKVKPGRYRFTSQPYDDDGERNTYAVAEYLGPCGEIPPVKHVLDGRSLLTPTQYVNRQMARYGILYAVDFETAKFRVFDQLFNVLGNGIRSYGEFMLEVTEAGDVSEKYLITPPAENEVTGKVIPYPNFDEQYSILYRAEIDYDFIGNEWVNSLIEFYTRCEECITGQNSSEYDDTWCGKTPNDIERWTTSVNSHRKPNHSDEEFHAAVSKTYGVPFDGNVEALIDATRKLRNDKHLKFIRKTIKMLKSKLN